MDEYFLQKKKNILFEQGDFNSAFYFATINTCFQIYFTKKTRNEPLKANVNRGEGRIGGEMFTGIGIMSSFVKDSTLTEKLLILY